MNDAGATTMKAASLSDVGRKRKSNQDHCGEFTGAAGERILVLCDGMGGHQGGEVASQLAVATIGEVVAAGGGSPEELLRKGFERAHERLRARAAQDPDLRGMGTTAVTLLAPDGESVWVAHTGDSRAYRVRAGQVQQLTADHSVVAEQLRRGLISPAEAEQLPHNELLHALGASAQLRVDVGRHDLRAGDRFVLCSDGLWNLVEEREMAALSLQLEPGAAVRRLVELANERGANDNVTVQVLAFGPPGEAALVPDEDETERDLAALQVARKERSAEGPASADATLVADAASVEEIWERARGAARARRSRRLRLAAVGASVVAILLLGTLLWLRVSARQVARSETLPLGQEHAEKAFEHADSVDEASVQEAMRAYGDAISRYDLDALRTAAPSAARLLGPFMTKCVAEHAGSLAAAVTPLGSPEFAASDRARQRVSQRIACVTRDGASLVIAEGILVATLGKRSDGWYIVSFEPSSPSPPDVAAPSDAGDVAP